MLRLHLNAAALERLLGGDAEVEIRLRHQIVNEFARKHLKVIADSEAVREATKALRAVFDQEVRERIGQFVKGGVADLIRV